MTALYAIAAILVLACIMFGAYLIGFEDGVKAERIRRIITVESVTVTLDEDKHQLTHADLVQMETAAKNMTKDEPTREGSFTIDVLAEKLKKSKAWVVDWMTKHKIAAMPNNDGIETSYMEPQYMLTDEEYSQIGEDALK